MKKKIFRKNIVSFTRQGLAENLLPVSKKIKKKLVKTSFSSHFGAAEGRKKNLERNFSVDYSSLTNKFPHYPILSSRRMHRGKIRLFSQFVKKQERLRTFKNEKSNPNLSPGLFSARLPMQSAYRLRSSNFASSDKFTRYDSIKNSINSFQTEISLLISPEQAKSEIQSPFSKTKQKQEYSPFLKQIREKKKLKYLYGNLSTIQLKKIAQKAQQMPGTTADNLFILLESRLDTVCQRCQFFATIRSARQHITHKGIWINSQLVTIPSYQLSPGDVIRLIDPKKTKNPFSSSLPIKNWKKACVFIKSLKNELSKNGLNSDSITTKKQVQKETDNFSKVSVLKKQKVVDNFIEFLKTEYKNNRSLLNASAPQLLLGFFSDNQSFWKTVFYKKLNLIPSSSSFVQPKFLISKEIHNIRKNRNFYNKWLLFLIVISAFTNSSYMVFNKSQISFHNQVENIACFLEKFFCIRFVSRIVDKLPDRLNRSIKPDSDQSKKLEKKGCQDAFLLQDLKKKSLFLPLTYVAYPNYDLVEIKKKKVKKTRISSVKKLFSWVEKQSHLLFNHFHEKKHLLSTNSFDSNAFLMSSPHFPKYVLFIFLLYMRNSFMKYISKKLEKAKRNSSFTSNNSNFRVNQNNQKYTKNKHPVQKQSFCTDNDFQVFTEKMEKSSIFYQKKSKPLHIEVSYQSLSAIFLFPPQRVYLNAIIDSSTVIKALLK